MQNADPLRIAIGLPSTGFIRTETTVSLVSAITSTPGVYFFISNPTGCYIHQNREEIALKAKEKNSTHLLFVDSDMAFPPNAISTLIKSDKPIIGASYNFRRPGPQKSVIMLDPDKHKKGGIIIKDDPVEKGKKMSTIEYPKEPFECKAIGAGFMLIQMWVFEKLPRPWFFFKPSSDPEGMIGEDTWFCLLARKHGIGVWCDPTIPMTHVGTAFY